MVVIRNAQIPDAQEIAQLERLLLQEIMTKTNMQHFEIDEKEIVSNIQEFIRDKKMFLFIATDGDKYVGFVGTSESYALYTHGKYGIITELFVLPEFREKQIGRLLLEQVRTFGVSRQWKRLEVTTPPLPEFQRSLEFYLTNQFAISGGRKLKLDLSE